uniref:Bucky ball n=1 Tax=Esox lucius TaxID=8010 RepID=A0A3P8XRI5_ESOLU
GQKLFLKLKIIKTGGERGPSRPFFYVQPPSQPYYNMYHHHNQWHMNSPYNHYGLPGSGYPFGRFSPYMSPYPYMQYPGGYVVPHAPHMHPIDYRRMYEPPRFHPPPGHDIAQAQREMACSEVQTDPSDALNKLIECLDKLRTNETQGSDKELDSGVVSQASGIFSPDERRRKHEEDVEVGVDGMHSHSEALLRGKLEGSHLQSSSPMARLFSANDSTTAVYDGESSRSLGDPGHPEGWAVDSDEDPPQDSSSVHEENVENQELLQYHPDEEDQESLHRCSSENICLLSAASQADESVLQTDSPDSSAALLCEDLQASLSSALLATTTTSSPANHHYYPYYCPPQTAHERLSVLSPSLDELSSRDEVFSTDLDDLDVFPRHGVYAGRRFSGVEEVCPKSKKLMCACCGSSLFKGTGSGGRVKGHHHSPKVYADDQEGDTDEEQRGPVRTFERPQPVRVVVKKHSVPKKRQPLSLHCRRPAENSCKRSQCREAVAQEEPPEDPAMGLMGSELDHCEGHGLQAQGVHEAANKQHRACKGR